MTNKEKELRRHKRFYFSPGDRIEGIFSLSLKNGESNLVTANIMDISAGGLNLAFKRHDVEGIRSGDRLILEKIKGSKKLEFCINMELEVRWTMGERDRFFKHIGMGCQFQNISEALRQQIVQFVDSEIASQSQRNP